MTRRRWADEVELQARPSDVSDLPIFAAPVEPPPRFHGETIDPEHDLERLGDQYVRVFALMADARWRTLAEIREATGAPEASCSARLRDYRKAANGGHTVHRRRRGEARRGLFEYQLLVNAGPSRVPECAVTRHSDPPPESAA